MTIRRVGPGVVGGLVVVGILLGDRRGPNDAAAPGLAAIALVGLAVLSVSRGRGSVGFACCCVAALLGGLAVTGRALDGRAHSPLTEAVTTREGAVVDVTLTTDPKASRFAATALGRVERVRTGGRWRPAGGRTVVLDASGDAAMRVGVLRAGDRARLAGYFRPLDRYESSAQWEHAVGAFAAHDVRAARPPSAPLMRLAGWLRARVLAGHRTVPEPPRALLAGFLLGDTSGLPDAVVDDFRASGLSHLVAVSGQNVAVVLALCGPFVRRGHRVLRLVLGLAVLVVFAAMTRFEPSVLRASAMAACSMTSVAAGRPTAGLRSLTLAVTVLLIVDPFLLHSIGFLLSCSASIGIAVLTPGITRALPGPRPLAESAAVTIGAQIAVAPVLLAVFDGIPLVAIPANVLVAPVAGPLTVLGLAGGVVGGVVGGPVAAAATFPAFVCASIVLVVARAAAQVPIVVAPHHLLLALPGLVIAGVVFAVRRVRRATWSGAAPRPARPRLALPPR